MPLNQPSEKPDYDTTWKTIYGEMQDRGPTHRHMRRIISNILSSIDYESVLDIGCGAGHNIPIILDSHPVARYTGSDISQYALDQARKLYKGEFRKLDIEQGHLPDQYDLVISSLLMEHLPNDVTALKNMRHMCRKHLLLTTIAGDFERYRAWDEQMGHVRNYQVGELENKLEHNGFSVVKTIYWGFPFYTPIARSLQNTVKSQNKLTLSQRIATEVMYWLYFFNSFQRGDILFVLARPQ